MAETDSCGESKMARMSGDKPSVRQQQPLAVAWAVPTAATSAAPTCSRVPRTAHKNGYNGQIHCAQPVNS